MALPKLLSTEELAKYLGDYSVRTVELWRRFGTGPDFIKVGRHVRYREDAVDRWLKQQERNLSGSGDAAGAA